MRVARGVVFEGAVTWFSFGCLSPFEWSLNVDGWEDECFIFGLLGILYSR